MTKRDRLNVILACEQEGKKIGERETEEFGERSDRGGTGEAPSLRWGLPEACSQVNVI